MEGVCARSLLPLQRGDETANTERRSLPARCCGVCACSCAGRGNRRVPRKINKHLPTVFCRDLSVQHGVQLCLHGTVTVFTDGTDTQTPWKSAHIVRHLCFSSLQPMSLTGSNKLKPDIFEVLFTGRTAETNKQICLEDCKAFNFLIKHGSGKPVALPALLTMSH